MALIPYGVMRLKTDRTIFNATAPSPSPYSRQESRSSDVVIIYGRNDFYNVAHSKFWGKSYEDIWYQAQFDVFREMYAARDYRLVLQAPRVGNISLRELERGVAGEKAKGGFPHG